MTRVFVLLVMSWFCAATPMVVFAQKSPASSQETDPAKLFEEAQAYYNLGNYTQALVLLEKSYLLSKQPDLLYNMALCQQKLGKNEDALTLFRSFLRESPTSPLRSTVESKILELQDLLAGKVTVEITSSPSGAEVRRGGASSPVIGKTPFTASLDAGSYYFTLTLSGYEPHGFDLETKPSKSYVIPEIRLLAKPSPLPPTSTTTTAEPAVSLTSLPESSPASAAVVQPSTREPRRLGIAGLSVTTYDAASETTSNSGGGFLLEYAGNRRWKSMRFQTQFVVIGGSSNAVAIALGAYWQKPIRQKWIYEFSLGIGPITGEGKLALGISLTPIRFLYQRHKSSNNLLSVGFSAFTFGPNTFVMPSVGYQRAF
jgi:hypothetical protein